MGVREMDRYLEQRQIDAKALRRRMILAATPRERALSQAQEVVRHAAVGPRLDRSSTAEALERAPHTIGRWLAAFGERGPAALIFQQTGGPPPPLVRGNRRN